MAIIRDIRFVLPDVDVREVKLQELTDFNIHQLEEQYRKDLLLSSFYGMLQVEIRHKLARKENEETDHINQLAEDIRAAAEANGDKLTETRLKTLVQLNPDTRRLRDEALALNHQLTAVGSVVSDLNRKAIALNVFVAKTRTELGAGLGHH